MPNYGWTNNSQGAFRRARACWAATDVSTCIRNRGRAYSASASLARRLINEGEVTACSGFFGEQTNFSTRSLGNKQVEENRSVSLKFRVCLISCDNGAMSSPSGDNKDKRADMWHVLSLPGRGTVNNQANWDGRTLLAPSVSVLLYGLLLLFSLIECSLKASIRSVSGQYGTRLAMGKRFSRSNTAQGESGRLCTK